MDIKSSAMLLLLYAGVLAVRGLYDRARKKAGEGYDERQELLRGRGYRAGFYTITGLELAFLVLNMGGELPISTDAAILLSVVLGGTVFCVYCVWNGALWAMGDTPQLKLFLMLVYAAMCFAITLDPITGGQLTENGRLTVAAGPLMIGAAALIVAAAMALRWVTDGDDGGDGK